MCVSLLSLALFGEAAMAQKVAVTSVSFPKAQASTSQPVKFQVHNYDFANPYEGKATVGIKDADGTVLCQQEIDLNIPKMGNQDVQLPIRLTTDYGKSYAYTVFVDVDGNQTAQPNMDVKFTMPTTVSAPLTWSADLAGKSVLGYGKFKYFSDPDMFVAQGRVSMVNKGGVETLPITFEKDKQMTVSFSHYSDLASTVTVVADYGERQETVYSEECGISTKLTSHYCSFKADSTAIIRLVATAKGSFNTYGQMQLGQLSVTESKPDLSMDEILSPAASSLCTSADGYEVKVRVKNNSPFDIANPTLAFSFSDQEVSEQYEGTIKAFESLDYTFKTRLQTADAWLGQLKATVTSADDSNADNNSVLSSIRVYAPMTFPYTTGFDAGNDLWTVYDGNNDGVIWGFDSSSSLGNIAYFPADALASNDWLISPAISMPKGRSRLSFYYSGGTRLTQHLRVLMGTEPSVDKMTEVLFDENVKNNGWLNGYHVIDLDEAGLRYFAFQTTGKSDQIIIDNIKIDQAEDLCIGSVDFKEKSGFAKTTSKVTLSYINHGVTPQKNITLRYWLNTADDPYAPTKTPYAEETVADEVQPGETVTYTFEKEADVSKGGETYALVGSIVTKVGEDQQNDLIAGTTSLENWAVPSLPYTQGFEESTTAQKQWTFTQEGTSKWLVGNNTAGAYQGSKSLCHTGKVAEGKEDLAFSEPLQLEKGTYDIAFFYRTTKNYKLATQAQTFRAMLGTAPEADKMTTQLLKEEDLLVSGQWSKKYSGTVTVDEAGTYYLGFGNTTANAQGMTFIDNISVSAHADGQTLPYALNLDADNAEEGMEKYYPSSTVCQWKLTDQEDGSKAEVVERTQMFSDLSYSSDGYLVLPKLQVEKGKEIKLTFDYSLVSELTPDLTLDVFDGTVSNPAAFTKQASLPVVADGSFATTTVTLPAVAVQAEAASSADVVSSADATTNLFVAFRTSAPEDGAAMKNGYIYTAKIKNVSLTYADATGISDINANNAGVTLVGGVISGNAPITVYDLAGRKVAAAMTINGKASLNVSQLNGVYVVKVGDKVVKMIFK